MDDLVGELYRRHAQELTVALALSLNDSEAAEDLAHETFLRAVAAEAVLREHPDPRGWLFRTGYNLARNWLRVAARRRHQVARRYPVVPPAAWEDSIDLRSSLGRLSRRQRDAIVLHYYLGFGLEETADLLGCSEGAVKSHLSRGRAALARMLDTREAE